jgi:hypothetical protein
MDEDDDVALYVHSVAGGGPVGAWLVSADVDGQDGLGDIVVSKQVEYAKRFPSFSAAIEFWKEQSRVRPFRDDGMPNRPLTMLTVSPVRLSTVDEFVEMEEKLNETMKQ